MLIDKIKRKILVYPNPIHNTIFFNGIGLKKVFIYDESGKIVYSNITNENIIKNSCTPDLKKGIYFLKLLLDNSETQFEKIFFQPKL